MLTKILIVIPVPSSYLPGLLRAMKYLHIETMVFNSRGHTFSEKLIIGATRKTGLSEKLLNRRLVQTAKDFKPNLLFVMKGELVSEEALQKINSLGITTLNWFPDYINSFELAKKLANMYDYFFHFDPYATRLLKKLKLRAKIECLPFCSDILPTDSKPITGEYRYEISFVGNYYPIREKYLESITDLGLNIWGDKRWKKSSLAKWYVGNQLPNSQFAETSRSSKININIQHEYRCEGLVLRPFEVLGAGAFMLTDNKKDAQRLFRNQVVTVKNPEDLRKKAIYFLANDKERERVAARGYAVVRDRHTYVHRIREILKTIG